MEPDERRQSVSTAKIAAVEEELLEWGNTCQFLAAPKKEACKSSFFHYNLRLQKPLRVRKCDIGYGLFLDADYPQGDLIT